MRSWANVATLAKTRNLDGGFVAKAATGLPFLLEEGMEVAFVPPREDVIRRTQVETVELIDERTAEIHFADVDSIDVAHALVGCCCLVIGSPLRSTALIGGAPEASVRSSCSSSGV